MPRGFPSEQTKKTRQVRAERQTLIIELWFKGYTRQEILARVKGASDIEVRKVYRLIKERLTPKSIEALEYRRNKCCTKILLVQSTAWNIISETKNDVMKLSALRVITSSQELEAKVEGVTQERLVVGPEKEATKLLEEIKKLETESRSFPNGKDDGHKEVQAQTEELPPCLAGDEV